MCVEISKIGFRIRCFSWHVAPRPHGSHGPVEDAGCFSRTLIEYWPRSDFVKKEGNILLNAELLVISINQAISFIDKCDFRFEVEDLTPLCWYFLLLFHIGFRMIIGIWKKRAMSFVTLFQQSFKAGQLNNNSKTPEVHRCSQLKVEIDQSTVSTDGHHWKSIIEQ